MPYVPNSWLDGPAGGTPITAAKLGSIETQYAQAATYTDASFTTFTSTTGMLASKNGITYSGADEGGALNTLLTTAATFGVTVLLDSGKTMCASTAITPPSGSRLNLNGATIKVLAAAGSSTRILTISGVSDVQVFGGIIDGDKASYAPVTEQRHNIHIINSTRVYIRNLRSLRAKGDGIYVGDNVSGPSSEIFIENVVSDSNHRQGMSVSHVDGLNVSNSWFINTSGTAPQSGVDIEPNDAVTICQNLKFVGCHFIGNAGQGFQVALQATPTARQGGIALIGCTFSSNAADGLSLNDAADVRVIGGEARLNTGRGVRLTTAKSTIHKSIELNGVTVANNQLEGIALTYGVDGLSIIACDVRDNGQATSNTYAGINLSPSVASINIRVVGNVSGGAQQKYGMLTGSNITGLTMVGNQYPSNSTAATSLGDDVSTRVMFDQARAYFPTQMSFRAAGGTTLADLWVNGEANARLSLRNDGHILIGPGSITADVDMFRSGTGVLSLAAANTFKTGQNVTASRPSASTVGAGAQFYDTTLTKPIWSDGTNWKDASGTIV